LNQAFIFLQKEHQYIADLESKLFDAPMVISDVSADILENNLFGVDINEESVEIARLSLWLRSAKKGRKLNNLSDNIKCGNSLIDDPEVAGEKAFKWEEEFPQVFAKGGFDVVIGNPPYVKIQNLDYRAIDNLKTKFKTALKRIDISLCFIELSKSLIKCEIGVTSFITSNQFLTTEYGEIMRKFLISEYFLSECVDFGDLPIFTGATTYVSIFTLKNKYLNSFLYFDVKNIFNAVNKDFGRSKEIKIATLTKENWNLKNSEMNSILDKLKINTLEISTIGNAWYGIITGADHIYIFSKKKYLNTNIEKELFIPLIRAQNCSKYYSSKPQYFVLYPYKIVSGKSTLISYSELESSYPNGFKYLLSHKSELEQRKDSRSTYEK
jgi:tRNA1(Val) A37 N6-methylase TrmN6